MTVENETMTPEWSYMFDADEAVSKVQTIEISPDEDEVKSLLKRLGISGLESLKATLKIKRQSQVVHVNGALSATVIQPCVLTLEPVKTEVSDSFDAWYADPDAAISIAKKRREKESKKGRIDVPMLEESEDPEAIIDGQIDLGELVTQYLSLSISPYVQAEGVDYGGADDAVQDGSGSDHRENPFAALKDWKDKLK